MKSKSIYWKYSLLKIKYIFLRDSYVCTRWIFIFDSDQAQINSVSYWPAILCSLTGTKTLSHSQLYPPSQGLRIWPLNFPNHNCEVPASGFCHFHHSSVCWNLMNDRSFKTEAAEKLPEVSQTIRRKLVRKNIKKAAKLSIMTFSHHSRSYFYFMEPLFGLPCSLHFFCYSIHVEVKEKII